MPVELLSSEYSVGGMDISGSGLTAKRTRDSALRDKIAAHDPGFFGAVWEGTRSSLVIHALENQVPYEDLRTPDMYADAREYEDGYDWRADDK